MSQNVKIDNPWYYYIGTEIIKKRKPCLTGDYVHLKNLTGCYKVYCTSIRSFVIMKNHNKIEIPWEQFRCLKGHGDSEETVLKRQLKEVLYKINVSIVKQTDMSELLNNELKNLRRTFA